MSRVPPALAAKVRSRAGERCEYCHLRPAWTVLPFQIDHIIAQQHKGATDEANLAFACLRCNGRKGPNLSGIDPVSGEITPLFHPRRDAWKEHFEWHNSWLFGRTARARATIQVLGINDPDVILTRESLMLEGHDFA